MFLWRIHHPYSSTRKYHVSLRPENQKKGKETKILLPLIGGSVVWLFSPSWKVQTKVGFQVLHYRLSDWEHNSLFSKIEVNKQAWQPLYGCPIIVGAKEYSTLYCSSLINDQDSEWSWSSDEIDGQMLMMKTIMRHSINEKNFEQNTTIRQEIWDLIHAHKPYEVSSVRWDSYTSTSQFAHIFVYSLSMKILSI